MMMGMPMMPPKQNTPLKSSGGAPSPRATAQPTPPPMMTSPRTPNPPPPKMQPKMTAPPPKRMNLLYK